MRVLVEQYNPLWASQFAAIKQDLEKILHEAKVSYQSIEHAGSTSVPGLAAKPHIDLDIVVSESDVQPVIAALVDSGKYQSLGELGIPKRHAMHYLPPADNVTVPGRSTYVCVEGCQSLRNHLAIRDVCRASPDLRDEYSRVKLELSQRDWEDVGEYCEAKNEVLGRILRHAGMDAEVDAIRDINVQARSQISNAVEKVNSETSKP